MLLLILCLRNRVLTGWILCICLLMGCNGSTQPAPQNQYNPAPAAPTVQVVHKDPRYVVEGQKVNEKPERAYGMSNADLDNIPQPTGRAKVVRTPGQVEIYSPLFLVDRIYRSMEGPDSRGKIRLLKTKEPELIWITGCHAEMMDKDLSEPMPPQFMCHANFDLNTERHSQIFGGSTPLDGRLFTLSQGQLHVKFPKGFGIPLRSDEALEVAMQVLNLNVKDANLHLRHHVTIEFVRDSETEEQYYPLFESGVFAMKSLEGEKAIYDASNSKHAKGAMCLPGKMVNDWDTEEDCNGKKFTGHWVIEPGREINRTRVTTLLAIPFDTTIHYIAVHLHPFAETLELRDLTTKKTIFTSKAINYKDRVGLEHVEAFSSEEGIPVFSNHEYELVSVYNNTSGVEQDSMAVMYVYMKDHNFDPESAGLIQKHIGSQIITSK